jgi:hypothetical protein
LEEDLDSLLQKPEATACREALGCFDTNNLMITSTLEGRFVHWKGMSLFDLLEADDRLVAHLEPLPFQEGRPLATVAEGSTELVDVSSDKLISCQVLMAEEVRAMAIFPSPNLMMYLKMRSQPMPAPKMTPIVRHGKPGTEPAQSGGGGSTSAGNLCSASLTLNSPP